MNKKRKGLVSFIVIIFFVILFIGLIVFVESSKKNEAKIEEKKWNNGICIHCNNGKYSFYYAFEEKYDYQVHHFYKCDNCGYSIDLIYYTP